MKSVVDIIAVKRDGEELTTEDIDQWVKLLTEGQITEAQLGAWLMACYLRGLNSRETADLTKSMTFTGDVMSWPVSWRPIIVDKHSTGGVGDKVSLVLAPALAACGRKVPMISGRGLGITGGTLDKLESIPGFRVALTAAEIMEALDTIGCVIAGQTGKIAPADKAMYSCRDVTGTVGNLSLQTSSIISKKAAEGLHALVLDVKFGRGSYQPTLEYAEKMARSLVSVAEDLGIKTTAVISEMDSPVGQAIGNALEVAEAIRCLEGNGPKDLVELVVKQGALLLQSSGLDNMTSIDAEEKINESLKSGSALAKFFEMIQFQGVAAEVAKSLCYGNIWDSLAGAKYKTEFVHEGLDGRIQLLDAQKLGRLALDLGAGRSVGSGSIDHTVGLELLKSPNDIIKKNQAWIRVHHSQEVLSAEIKARLDDVIVVDDGICAGQTKSSKITKVMSNA